MNRLFAYYLAEAFLRGRWTADDLTQRVEQCLIMPKCGEWIGQLANRVVEAFPELIPPRLEVLIRFLQSGDDVLDLLRENGLEETIPEFDLAQLPDPAMKPTDVAIAWQVKPLASVRQVAEWLEVSDRELTWFAGLRSRRDRIPIGPLQHYRYRWIAKSSGGYRLLEIPKPRLKQMQRRILEGIVSQIPPHRASHAYQHGRSVASYVAPHAGQRHVLHIDLRDFFPSIQASQVHSLFRTAGYPERVASVLTGICTNIIPHGLRDALDRPLSDTPDWRRYQLPHLPQGAPTSPCLANLSAFRLDCRLTGLANQVGATYTRYADDLTFSGGTRFQRCCQRFRTLTSAIVHNEGFEIRRRKTREMTSGERQQISGITINQHPNLPRSEYDSVRATLFNCSRFGPDSQNIHGVVDFRRHLLGKLAYWSTICPQRTHKLKAIFDRIVWD
jgi:RNA-directed DNA polymerase